MKWVWWKLARYLRFHNSPTVTFDQSSRGITAHVRTQAGGTTSVPGSGNYRGLWLQSPPSPYMIFDEVLIQAGVAAGHYISVIDYNSNDPSTGVGWVQLAGSNTVGQWA